VAVVVDVEVVVDLVAEEDTGAAVEGALATKVVVVASTRCPMVQVLAAPTVQVGMVHLRAATGAAVEAEVTVLQGVEDLVVGIVLTSSGKAPEATMMSAT